MKKITVLMLTGAICASLLTGCATHVSREKDLLSAQDTLVVRVAMLDRARILRLANAAMALRPPAITDAVATNSAGGLHDFFSQADYAWPNPTNVDGLPFNTRDGESNPDTFTAHRMAMRHMKDAVAALTAAYVLTGDDKYVTKAAGFIRVFFLDPATRMNPNLQYAQAVLGAQTGNPYGVIDTLHLAELAVAARFLERSPAFPPEVDRGLKQWFADYCAWIEISTNGVKEMHNANNHSMACYLQLAAFAKYTGDEQLLAACRERFRTVLLPRQMTNDGSFPLELKRTKPYGYSIFQADNVAELCVLLSTTNEDFWRLTLPDGRTPRNAVDFIYPYLADKNKWLADGRRKDLMHWDDWPVREPCLIFAYAAFGDEKYFDLWQRLDADPANLEVRRNLAVTQPLLWLARPEDAPLTWKDAIRNSGAGYDRRVMMAAIASNHLQTGSPFFMYDSAMVDDVTEEWYKVLDAHRFASKRAGKVVLKFRLDPDGSVTGLKTAENHAGALPGYACVAAIEKCSPFAPWPPDMVREIGADYRDISFTFYYQ